MQLDGLYRVPSGQLMSFRPKHGLVRQHLLLPTSWRWEWRESFAPWGAMTQWNGSDVETNVGSMYEVNKS